MILRVYVKIYWRVKPNNLSFVLKLLLMSLMASGIQCRLVVISCSILSINYFDIFTIDLSFHLMKLVSSQQIKNQDSIHHLQISTYIK